MIRMKKIWTFCVSCFGIFAILGAENKAIEIIRGNAKFNTVAAVLILIFVVLGITLFVLDLRIRKLEKEKKKST